MTIPLWCLFAGAFLPYVWSTGGLIARGRQFGALDNKRPRAQLAKLEGWGERSNAAQKNAWEALAVFTPAVLCAHVTNADPKWSAWLAIGWVVFRMLHGIVYVSDLDKLRTAMFTGAFICATGLFVLSTGWV